MADTSAEQEILEQAIAAFSRQVDLRPRLRMRLRANEEPTVRGQWADFTMEIGSGRFLVEIKKWAPQANPGVLIERLKGLPKPGMLVADYVNPKMAERFREQGVMFMDTAGNAYINVPPFYAFIKGNRIQDGILKRKEKPHSTLEAAGSKVVHALLCNPRLAEAAYRKIAETVDVALGTVSQVFQEMKAAGYLGQAGGVRRLQQYGKLLEQWTESFSEKLQSRLWLGRYAAEDPDWWERVDIKKYNGYWGGEIAAAKYTGYLKPSTATVFFHGKVNNRFFSENRLREQVTANEAAVVDIYRMFWKSPKQNYPELVDPVTVYAELLAAGDAGNVERAKVIREKYLAEHIRQYG